MSIAHGDGPVIPGIEAPCPFCDGSGTDLLGDEVCDVCAGAKTVDWYIDTEVVRRELMRRRVILGQDLAALIEKHR
jgi:hypothetical protein